MKKDANYYKKELEKQKEELLSLKKLNERQTRIINQLNSDRDTWQIKYAETLNEYHKAMTEYESVINSKFWTISDPIRNFLNNARGLKREEEQTKFLEEQSEDYRYQLWIENNEVDIFEFQKQKYNPLISIVVPVYNVENKILKECIDSVLNQTYKNYQLILVDDKSSFANVKKELKKYEKLDNVDIIYRKENGGISEATNSGLKIVKGEFVGFLDCDDTLAPNALYEVVKLLNENKKYDFIYSDEDKITEDSKTRYNPNFKPDWSPDTYLWSNYTNHFSVYRKKIVDKTGLFRKEFDGSQDYDFVLRFLEHTSNDRIGHITKVLYHWRARKESTASSGDAKPKAVIAAKNAKLDTIKRRKLDAYLDENDVTGQYQIYYNHHNELVSIIIPSKDNYDVLKVCIDSLIELTAYKNYEVIVVDNGSNDENKNKIKEYLDKNNCQYIYKKEPFNFSHMCNVGAKQSKGEYLLFLNDDTEILQADWLDKMLGQACQKHSGAVGCKLLYPDSNIIQHCGIVNYSSGPSTYFTGCDDSGNYYFYRTKANYNCVAVTGACLIVNKDKYWEVDGFNEELPNDYNDLDLCFKLLEKGYYNISLNQVILYHYESLSRKEIIPERDKMLKIIRTRNLLYELNPKYLMYDPYYNINLSQKDNMFNVDVY